MKRYKLLRTVGLVGILAVIVLALVHPSIFDALAGLASGARGLMANSPVAPVWRWIQEWAAHLTARQLVIGAVVAWFIFVVSLILLARSGRRRPRAQGSPVDGADAAPRPNNGWPDRTPTSGPAPYPPRPPQLSAPPPEREAPRDYPAYTGGPAPRAATGATPVARQVSSPSVPQRVEREGRAGELTNHAPQAGHGRAGRRRGRALALTGISVADGRPLPYGLFVVAEDAGNAHDDGTASRRAIEVIAEQVAPCLADAQTLGSAQLAALLKIAVMRASIDLYQRGIRAAADLGVKVTGVMLAGDVAHVVNVGDCRAYAFRPSAGLAQITTDHSIVSCLVDTELLQPEALYTHPRRGQVYRRVGGDEGVAEVDTCAVGVRPGDSLLLCSPGLCRALRPPQIEAILRAAADPQSAAEMMAREVVGRGGGDGFSVIVVYPSANAMPRLGAAAG